MTRPTILTLTVLAAALAAACSSDPVDPLGSPSLPASGGAAASPTAGQQIWVAVLAEGADSDVLEEDLATAQKAVGEYLASRVVITEPSCYEGLGPEVDGPSIVAIQDSAEHGVHAMFLEITDEPLFYGPVTLRC